MAAVPPLALMPVAEGATALPGQGADVYKDIRSGDVGNLVTKSGPAFGTNAAMTGLMATYGARGLRGAEPGVEPTGGRGGPLDWTERALPLESSATQFKGPEAENAPPTMPQEAPTADRSEERRVGKEGRSRW